LTSSDRDSKGKTEKLLLRALRGETCERPPIWLMRQAGRYLPEYRKARARADGFLDLCFTPELAVEVTLQPIRRYGFDAAIMFSDILVLPHALGQKVWFEEGHGPRLEALRSAEDVAALSGAGLHEALAPVYETVSELRRRLPAETSLIGFAGAPWTVASYMVEGGSSKDFATVKGWAYGDSGGFQRLIDLLVGTTADYLKAQVEAGAEALQLFDSWAGALPEAALKRWCLEPAKAIVQRVKAAHPEVPMILFPRGAGLCYRDFARESGAEALGLDTTVPLTWAREELQRACALQGNLDPVLLTTGGQSLKDSARNILENLAGGPFVFNLGAGILPSAKPEYVADLVEIVRSWRPEPSTQKSMKVPGP
jgi:uroporphyrinogen decarboxylase